MNTTPQSTSSRRSVLLGSTGLLLGSTAMLTGCVTPNQQTQRPVERAAFKLSAAQVHWAPVGDLRISMRYLQGSSKASMEQHRLRTQTLERDMRKMFADGVAGLVQNRLAARKVPFGFAQHVLISPSTAVFETQNGHFQPTFIATVIDAKTQARWRHSNSISIYLPDGQDLGSDGLNAYANQLLQSMADASMFA
jgi:hypothetical protein